MHQAQFLSPEFVEASILQPHADHRVVRVGLATAATIFEVFNNSLRSQRRWLSIPIG